MEGSWGQAYNEEAFRYFLAIERKRAEGTARLVLLVLVDMEVHGSIGEHIAVPVARKIFSGLCRCLRDTDVVGWYRKGLVAGALLTESRDQSRTDVPRLIRERVLGVLGAHVPAHVARRLRVRVHRDPPSENFESGRLDPRAAHNPRRT